MQAIHKHYALLLPGSCDCDAILMDVKPVFRYVRKNVCMRSLMLEKKEEEDERLDCCLCC